MAASRGLDTGRAVVLLGSAAILALAFAMTPSDEAVSVFGYEVPTLCVWRATTGLSCPGCGLTRSFTYLAHGHVLEAFRMHALGPLAFLAVACQVPYQLYRMVVENPAGSGAPPSDA